MEIAKLILAFIEALVWPTVVLSVLLVYRNHIEGILGRIKKADLPGGVTIETFPEKIETAKGLSEQVKLEQEDRKEGKVPLLPLTEANAKMLNLGLAPSPSGLELSYYQALAEQDPNLALAALRIEVEAMLRNLATGFDVELRERDGAGAIARKLKRKGAITSRQSELIRQVIDLCNAAIHGLKVTRFQADEILAIAEVLRDEYVSWLSWGFPKGQEDSKRVGIDS